MDGFTLKQAIITGDKSDQRIVNNIVQTTNSGDMLISGDGLVIQHNFLDNGTNDGTGNNQNTGIVSGFIPGGAGVRNGQIIDNEFKGHESSAVNLNSNSQDVTVSGNSFSNDSSALVAVDTSGLDFRDNTGSGFLGTAVYLGVRNSGTLVRGNVLSNGQGSGVSLSQDDFGSGLGPSSGVQITGNSLSGFAKDLATNPSAAGVRVRASSYSGTLQVHYNRIAGNARGINNILAAADGSVDASDNYWGCNTGANTTGCDTVVADTTTTPSAAVPAVTPFLKLNVAADRNPIYAGGDSTPVRVFVAPSAGATPADLTFPDVDASLSATDGTFADSAVSLGGRLGLDGVHVIGQRWGPRRSRRHWTAATGSATETVQARPVNGTNGTNGASGTNGDNGTNGQNGTNGARSGGHLGHVHLRRHHGQHQAGDAELGVAEGQQEAPVQGDRRLPAHQRAVRGHAQAHPRTDRPGTRLVPGAGRAQLQGQADHRAQGLQGPAQVQ